MPRKPAVARTLGDFLLTIHARLLSGSELEQILAWLKPRELHVTRARFGIGAPFQTLQEIARDFDVCPERIRQIEAKALRRARWYVHTHNLKAEPLATEPAPDEGGTPKNTP